MGVKVAVGDYHCGTSWKAFVRGLCDVSLVSIE
jgi:hypothetical protein